MQTPVEPTRADDGASADGTTASSRAGSAPDGAVTRPADGTQRDVRSVDGEVEWRCDRCDGWNPLTHAACVTCGAPRQGFGEVAPPPTLDASARARLVGATVVLPGLGHLLARRTGTGLARMILAVTWLLGAVLVAGGGGSGLPVAPLLLGVAIVWAGSLRDVLALVHGGRELLTSRVLLWLIGAVLLALLGALTLTTGGAGTA